MIFILICVDAAKSLPPLHGVPIQLEKTQSRYTLVVMSEKKELKTWQHRNRFRLQHYSIHSCVFFCLNSLSQYQMKCGLLHQWLLQRWLVRWCLFHFNLVYSTGAIEWLLPFTLLLYVWLKITPKRFVCLFLKLVSTCLPEKLKIRRFFSVLTITLWLTCAVREDYCRIHILSSFIANNSMLFPGQVNYSEKTLLGKNYIPNKNKSINKINTRFLKFNFTDFVIPYRKC